jgi:hypothetical protein
MRWHTLLLIAALQSGRSRTAGARPAPGLVRADDPAVIAADSTVSALATRPGGSAAHHR